VRLRPALYLRAFLLATLCAVTLGAGPGPAWASVEPTLAWNTFLGGSHDEWASAITVDAAGNSYVVGTGYTTWGVPLSPFTGNNSAFVAKLSPSGTLVWNTFLGDSYFGSASAVAVDGDGDVYVAGESSETWGSPVRPHSGDGFGDVFVAKVSPSGALLWNTFLGGGDTDNAGTLAVDGAGDVYVGGDTYDETWGAPLRPHSGGYDVFLAKLSTAGDLLWNTFLGGGGFDEGGAVAVDGSGNVYVAGQGFSSWGSPIRPHGSGEDAFVARLSAAGALSWHTFLGGGLDDAPAELAVDGDGDVCVVGYSYATWGDPVRSHSGCEDAFVAQLNTAGGLVWNTFLGGYADFGIWGDPNRGDALVVDDADNLYVAGWSAESWGAPLAAHDDHYDAFVAHLDSSGGLVWHTFIGGDGADFGSALAVNARGNLLVAGYTDRGETDVPTWGAPLRPYSDYADAFVARLTLVETLPTTIEVTSSSVTLAKYGAAYTFTGVLTSEATPLEGRTVILQKASREDGAWSSTAVTATTAGDGSFALRHVPRSKTFYRARFTTDGDYGTCTSDPLVSALPRAWVRTPIAPKVMYKGKAKAVYGYLKPRHTAGTFPVRIYKYRYVSGKWKSYGYVKAKAKNYSSYTKYTASVKLPYKGKWRLRALHPADAGHAKSWSSGYDYVTVK